MTAPGPSVITEAKDLFALTELDGIRFYEVSGVRRDDARDPGVEIEVRLRRDEREIEIRCAAHVTAEDADYRSDASAVFTLNGPVEISDAALSEFVERVGVMTVYPYLRESIDQSAAKLGAARPTMKLLRPGDITVSVPADETPSTR